MSVTFVALGPFERVDTEHYRDDLTAALVRIEQLEDELAMFRADPAHERVEIALERLARALERRRLAQRLLPRILIASFVLTGAFALTDPTLPPWVRMLGYAVSVAGAASAVLTTLVLLLLSAQGARPASVVELERQVRLAKGDVGLRREARLRAAAADDPPLLEAPAVIEVAHVLRR